MNDIILIAAMVTINSVLDEPDELVKKLKKAFSQKMNKTLKIISFGSFKLKASINGSMTIEAALIMPIFLFFMVSVLYIFQMIHIQTETFKDLHQRGNRIAFEGYQNRDRHVDGIVELSESYRIKPYLLWQDFGQLEVVQLYYGYAWVGYDINREGNGKEISEEYVYIAETGTVYHVTMDCSHLKLSITSVAGNALSSLRNDSGGKYHPCERCPDENVETFFITTFGNRYHSDINCSGLKRTVSVLEINEAIKQGYRGCSRCA